MRSALRLGLLLVLFGACVPTLSQRSERAPERAPQRPPTAATAPLEVKAGSERAYATHAELREAFRYVKDGWSLLERNHRQLLDIARDPKFPSASGMVPLYLPQNESRARIVGHLRKHVPAAQLAQIELLSLPGPDPFPIPEPERPGLLYLPRPYVVPGGRFNEMYGWDSYFILRGLLRDGELTLARAMVENFVYEIENYGTVLNANRSYYLSRSQPPLLTSMILAVHAQQADGAWLRLVANAIEPYHAYFVREPHLTPNSGLSRYYDLGEGPATEVLSAEKDEQGRTHYERVKTWFRARASNDDELTRFYDREHDALTAFYYLADRSMRESGFDPSERFGPFNSGVVDYNPVCLNSLLFRMETEAALIYDLLHDAFSASNWSKRAESRAQAIHRYLWDPLKAMFLDYDVRRGLRRDYPFATAFYPLWVGVASAEQAKATVENALPLLEAAGGLSTSGHRSGNQWDAPFGWAPLQLIAVEGLRRYGYAEQADRISVNFLSMVLKEFIEHHAMFEKYDVASRQSDVRQGIRFGYSSNEVGFGWTNAAFVTLFDGLSERRRADVLRLSGTPIASTSAPHSSGTR